MHSYDKLSMPEMYSTLLITTYDRRRERMTILECILLGAVIGTFVAVIVHANLSKH